MQGVRATAGMGGAVYVRGQADQRSKDYSKTKEAVRHHHPATHTYIQSRFPSQTQTSWPLYRSNPQMAAESLIPVFIDHESQRNSVTFLRPQG